MQSAFISQHLITDNIIIAYELFHTLKRKNQGRTGIMALKTDMSKAYDHIEWEYLRLIMLKMGFIEEWVSKLMRVVTTISYYFVRGSEEFGPLIPSRGLRQGDPLSSYLFIIYMEGHSAILSTFEAQDRIHEVARGAIPVSHLCFTNDALFFSKAKEYEVSQLKNFLSLYEAASRQCINFSKSVVCFTPNTDSATRAQICQSLGVQEVVNHGNCLGIPSVIGKEKRWIFQFIIEKAVKRL
ncbi:uncharacterized protein LOC105645129 [Jatropha curcas]|uniref:uncharacterized protein LOC105645129 n=1 Tax=Jatropha curcas TaxID=180498 RepID=UPI0005FAF133|nr:uncharacterized protein LOC105645129 [Jatropha curcas]